LKPFPGQPISLKARKVSIPKTALIRGLNDHPTKLPTLRELKKFSE